MISLCVLSSLYFLLVVKWKCAVCSIRLLLTRSSLPFLTLVPWISNISNRFNEWYSWIRLWFFFSPFSSMPYHHDETKQHSRQHFNILNRLLVWNVMFGWTLNDSYIIWFQSSPFNSLTIYIFDEEERERECFVWINFNDSIQ